MRKLGKVVEEAVYIVVGQYKDLLTYLMRRLLENGANASFINMVKDKEKALNDVVYNPIKVARLKMETKSQLIKPLEIFNNTRASSQGYELGIKQDMDEINNNLLYYASQNYKISSLINGKQTVKNPKDFKILQPASLEEIAIFDKASAAEIKKALSYAYQAFNDWSKTEIAERTAMLVKFAYLLHENRYFFYSLLIREAGKNIKDSIVEVREAIDFARYYAHRAQELLAQPMQMLGYTGESNALSMHGRGVFVCISPWNFPLAIFTGQVLAALVTGNTVIAKTAELTPVVAYEAVKLMHEAGVPGDVLQILIANGSDISKELLQDHRVAGVCFTGSTGIARAINRTLASRDCLISPFIAETGGQNAMIVDSSALLEQATDSIVNSAFGSMGQRCSALRVLYIQEEIYNPLIEMVTGAMNELKIGNTMELENDLGPVISASAKNELLSHVEKMKQQGFKIRAVHKSNLTLEKMLGHYLAPHIIEINKISDIEKENFGPILHVKPFTSYEIDKVIEEINSTGYGLTFGIHSRIMTKIRDVAAKIKAGNIYANRSMIGAQVESGNSGTSFKAGGPNYLLRFMSERTLTINTTAIGGNIELLNYVI